MIKFIFLFLLVTQGFTGFIALLCPFFPKSGFVEDLLGISFSFYLAGLLLLGLWVFFSKTEPLEKNDNIVEMHPKGVA